MLTPLQPTWPQWPTCTSTPNTIGKNRFNDFRGKTQVVQRGISINMVAYAKPPTELFSLSIFFWSAKVPDNVVISFEMSNNNKILICKIHIV